MKTVLIAEDNPVNRELLRELLEIRGYAVIETCNGQEALEHLEKVLPDILLLDLNMPVLDGFATIEKIRKHPDWSRLPVLAVTAYAMRGDREKILSAGFDGYLSKPIDPTFLQQELQRFLSRETHKQAPAAQVDAAGQGS
jgi:two-component system, cell cycle response regulator DivK